MRRSRRSAQLVWLGGWHGSSVVACFTSIVDERGGIQACRIERPAMQALLWLRCMRGHLSHMHTCMPPKHQQVTRCCWHCRRGQPAATPAQAASRSRSPSALRTSAHPDSIKTSPSAEHGHPGPPTPASLPPQAQPTASPAAPQPVSSPDLLAMPAAIPTLVSFCPTSSSSSRAGSARSSSDARTMPPRLTNKAEECSQVQKHPFFHLVFEASGTSWLAVLGGTEKVFATAEAAARAVDQQCLSSGRPRLNFKGEGHALCSDVASAGDDYAEVSSPLQFQKLGWSLNAAGWLVQEHADSNNAWAACAKAYILPYLCM